MPFKILDSDDPVPENTGKNQGNKPTKGRFKRGVSGNPKGRPKCSRNRASLLAEALLDGESEQITRKLIEKAKDGDLRSFKEAVRMNVHKNACLTPKDRENAAEI